MARNLNFIEKLAYVFSSHKRSITLNVYREAPILMHKGPDNLYHSDYYKTSLNFQTISLINAFYDFDVDKIGYLLSQHNKSIDFNTPIQDKPNLIFYLVDLALILSERKSFHPTIDMVRELLKQEELRPLFLETNKDNMNLVAWTFRDPHEKIFDLFLHYKIVQPSDHVMSQLFGRLDLTENDFKKFYALYELFEHYKVDKHSLGLEGQTLFYHAALYDSKDNNNKYGYKLGFLIKEGLNVHQKNYQDEHVIEALAQAKFNFPMSNFTFLIDKVEDIPILQSTYEKIQVNSVFTSRPEQLEEISTLLSSKISSLEKKLIEEGLQPAMSTPSVSRKPHKI